MRRYCPTLHYNIEREAIKKIRTDPKFFYRYANRTRKNRSSVGPLKLGEKYYSGEEDMARILSEQ